MAKNSIKRTIEEYEQWRFRAYSEIQRDVDGISSVSTREKKAWPELVGVNGEVAAATIERENPTVQAIILPDGSPATLDFRCNRVRVWVDPNGVVIREPHVG